MPDANRQPEAHESENLSATADAVSQSLTEVRRYLAGRAELADALEALRHLEYVCAQPVRGAIAQLRRCLFWRDDGERNETALDCLALIGGWMSRYNERGVQ